MKNKTIKFLTVAFVVLFLAGFYHTKEAVNLESTETTSSVDTDVYEYEMPAFTADNVASETPVATSIPAYSGSPYVTVNNNVPWFDDTEKSRTDAFENYSDLDELGRCGVAYANICPELMPTEERGPIGHIKPSGWHSVKYPEQIKDNYLYNRCHLIAFCLAGENDNEKNLITGTRYLNVDGMLPFEEKVAKYVDGTGNHVLYRVTPVFEGDNLIASGVYIEAYSVEDNGAGICFNVYCYNVQPGIGIDYASGNSWIEEN